MDCLRWQLVCSESSSGIWIRSTETNSYTCSYYNSLSITYKCFNGKWVVLTNDNIYHEFDEIYCVGPESKAMCD